MSLTEEDVLNQLVIKEEDVVKGLNDLVLKAQPFIRIEKESGKTIIITDKNVRAIDKVLMVLIGRYFAARLGFVESSSVSLKQLGAETRTIPGNFSKYLSQKVADGTVERLESGLYSIPYHNIEKVLEDMSNKYA